MTELDRRTQGNHLASLRPLYEAAGMVRRQPMAVPIADAIEEGMTPERIAERLVEMDAPQDALTRFFVTRYGAV